jgi:thermostable 8-oxoguanine DNA glycosylase
MKSDHLGKALKIKDKKQIPAVIKQQDFEYEVKRTKMIVEEIEKNMKNKKLMADSEPHE